MIRFQIKKKWRNQTTIPAFKLPGHTKLFKTKEWIILKNSKGKTHFKLYQLYFYAVSYAFEWNSVRKTAKIVAPKQQHNAKLSLYTWYLMGEAHAEKHHSGRLLWQSTGCWSIRESLEISGTNCSGGGFEVASTTIIAARKQTWMTDKRTTSACCGNQLAVEASARAWRFPERTAVAVDLRQHWRRQLLHENGRERQIDGQTGSDLGFKTSIDRRTDEQDLDFQDLDGHDLDFQDLDRRTHARTHRQGN
jgi:hypothetical protein